MEVVEVVEEDFLANVCPLDFNGEGEACEACQ